MVDSIQIQKLGLTLHWQVCHPDNPPRLNANELHLWRFSLQLSQCEKEQALSLLNDTQRDKYFRRATERLKESYLAGRYYLFHLLSAYSGIEPADIVLRYSRLNKPYLVPNPSDLQFNFTDTISGEASIGLFAFARGVEVGVDIEALNRQSNFAAIAAKRFSTAESKYVTTHQKDIDPQRFLSIWTRKEAYGKATGKGINFKMKDMDLASAGLFALDFYSQDQPAKPFRLQQIQLEDRFVASVVHASHQALSIKAFKSANHKP